MVRAQIKNILPHSTSVYHFTLWYKLPNLGSNLRSLISWMHNKHRRQIPLVTIVITSSENSNIVQGRFGQKLGKYYNFGKNLYAMHFLKNVKLPWNNINFELVKNSW
jgi:hypothetical protein